MNFTQKTIGFTLIELLVVITIIGILATGGVVTYTSQIQKARDTTRITDVKALQSGVEQFYQDKAEYPLAVATVVATEPKSFAAVQVYVPKFPKDPKTGQPCNRGAATNQTACDYLYTVTVDANGILNGEYKISTGFENSGNITGKAATDGGLAAEANRLELGLNLGGATKSTLCDRTGVVTAPVTGVVTTANCAAVPTLVPLMIAGNP